VIAPSFRGPVSGSAQSRRSGWDWFPACRGGADLLERAADYLGIRAAVDKLVEAERPPGLTFGPGGPGVEYGPVGPAKPGLLPGGPPGADPIATALDYLGLDAADLREAVRDGKSLADLAKDKGRSVDGLKEALRDAIRQDADKAVERGVLTKEQAARLVEKVGNTVDKFVEGSLKDGFDFAFGGGGRGFGLRLRIAPEGGTPAPRGPGDSSLGPTIFPPQPI
jgi:ribosomal protein S20